MSVSVVHLSGESDLSPAFAIRDAVFLKEQRIPMELERDEFETSCDHFIATLNDTPTATGRLRVVKNQVKFERIATLASSRGLGVGRALMVAMEEYARAQHPGKELIMAAQESALPFYLKLGWQMKGDTFVEAGIDHRWMVKS